MPDTIPTRWPVVLNDMERETSGEPAPCLRCNGTGTVFRATGADPRGGLLGYDDDCPQCGGSGEDEFSVKESVFR